MIDIREFKTTGFLIGDISPELLEPVWKEVNQIRDNMDEAEPYNEYHTGHLKHIFKLKDCKQHMEDIVVPFVKEYENHFKYLSRFAMLTEAVPVTLEDLFVNLQKKYEFNPIHNHDGVIGFVLYLKVPYYIEDEMKLSLGSSSNRNVAAHFQFTFTDTLGKIMNHAIPVDKRFENKIIVFPSQMFHSVFPFYSTDEERISVSGNFKFKVK